MDEADKADARIENTVNDALEQVRHYMTKRELEPCGACHWCNSYVQGARLFCSVECAEDHAKMKGRYK